MISGFHHSANEMCAPLGFYAACIDTLLQTFQDNLSVLEVGTRQVVLKHRQQTTNLHSVKIPEERRSNSNFL